MSLVSDLREEVSTGITIHATSNWKARTKARIQEYDNFAVFKLEIDGVEMSVFLNTVEEVLELVNVIRLADIESNRG